MNHNGKQVFVKSVEFDGSQVEVLEAVYAANNRPLSNKECKDLAKRYGSKILEVYFTEQIQQESEGA